MKKLCQTRVRLLILMIFLAIFLISIPCFVHGNESTSIAGNFRITEERYWVWRDREMEDIDQCVINEFGPGYKVADWNDILVYADSIEEWANELGMVWGDTCIVRRNGEDFYGWDRHYFIARWDHNKPGYWAAHDNIDNHLISLGSWYNIHYHILAIAFDITPPEITVSDDPIVLWPPNHKYHTIEISDFVLSVNDIIDVDCGIEDVVITSVSSDEPENTIGKGDGNTWNDIIVVDSQTVKLRAERQGKGNGRVYTINFEVEDASGNTAQGSFKIWVPHDKGSGWIAIDDGASAGYTVYTNSQLQRYLAKGEIKV